MKVRLISVTSISDDFLDELPPELHTPEGIMAYCARVSSDQQNNKNYARLLKYCIEHGHWSVFETVDMTVEITTSRAISAQLLRHRSFTFQEFSQRYQKVTSFEEYPARRQDIKNRQNSIDDMSPEDRDWFINAQKTINSISMSLYNEALSRGIAKEQARFLLPLSTQTRLYMKGTVRSWITYFMVRCRPETQKEHRDIAGEIWKIFKTKFPIISSVLKEQHSYLK